MRKSGCRIRCKQEESVGLSPPVTQWVLLVLHLVSWPSQPQRPWHSRQKVKNIAMWWSCWSLVGFVGLLLASCQLLVAYNRQWPVTTGHLLVTVAEGISALSLFSKKCSLFVVDNDLERWGGHALHCQPQSHLANTRCIDKFHKVKNGNILPTFACSNNLGECPSDCQTLPVGTPHWTLHCHCCCCHTATLSTEKVVEETKQQIRCFHGRSRGRFLEINRPPTIIRQSVWSASIIFFCVIHLVCCVGKLITGCSPKKKSVTRSVRERA